MKRARETAGNSTRRERVLEGFTEEVAYELGSVG